MATKKYELAVKTGEYTDRNSGETKGRYENIGVIMQGENGQYMILKRTFNAAGVPNPDNRDTVLVSMFEPRDNSGGQRQPQRPQGGGTQGTTPGDDLDDDIPFKPLDWRLA